MATTSKLPGLHVWFFCFFGLFVVLFLPVLLSVYGKSDDFSMLVNYQSGREGVFFNTHFAWGRPLLGLYDVVLFSIARDISDFAWIRLIGIIGISLFCTHIFAVYRNYIELNRSLAYAVCILCSPAFVVYVTWATCSAHGFSAALALLGGILAWRSSVDGISVKNFGISSLLLFAAQCVYQPTASFFLFPLVVALSFQIGNSGLYVRILKVSAIFLGVAFVYLLFTKLTSYMFFADTWLGQRMTISTNPLEKFEFFVKESIPTALALWAPIFSPTVVGVHGFIVGTLCCLALVLISIRNKSLIPAFSLLVILFLGSAPLLAASDNYTPPRALPFLYAIFVHLSLVAFSGLADLISGKLRNIVVIAAFGCALASAVAAFLGMVLPHAEETARLKEKITYKFSTKPDGPVVMLLPQWVQPKTAVLPAFHEFSESIIWTPWGADAFLNLVLWENGTIKRGNTIKIIPVQINQTWSTQWLSVFDAYDALGYQSRNESDSPQQFLSHFTGVGLVQEFNSAWFLSPWLGYFRSWNRESIHHSHLGRIQLKETENIDLLLMTLEGGMSFLVDSRQFPQVTSVDGTEQFRIQFYNDSSYNIISIPSHP
jgi:hypothetical protein